MSVSQIRYGNLSWRAGRVARVARHGVIKAKKASLDDARKVTTDRAGFMELFNSKAA
jgi:hypothetical protein